MTFSPPTDVLPDIKLQLPEPAYTRELKEENATAPPSKPESPEQKQRRAETIFASMFDEYVRFAHDPELLATYQKQEKKDLLAIKREQLGDYIKGSFIAGSFTLNVDLITGRKGSFSFEDLRDAYIDDGIMRATARYQAQSREAMGTPRHISTTEHDPNPEATHSFMQVIKEFGSRTLDRMGIGPHYHSGEINLPDTVPITTAEHLDLA